MDLCRRRRRYLHRRRVGQHRRHRQPARRRIGHLHGVGHAQRVGDGHPGQHRHRHAPGGVSDPNPGNNSATDTDTIIPQADLAITKTDGVTTATAGEAVTYTITATTPDRTTPPGATVADTFPAALTGVTWTCVGAGGGTCTAAGSGNIDDTVNLPAGGSVTYTATATVSPSATGTLSNSATVTAPDGVTDPNTDNDSATADKHDHPAGRPGDHQDRRRHHGARRVDR